MGINGYKCILRGDGCVVFTMKARALLGLGADFNLGVLFSINAAIQPSKQLRSTDSEGVTNAEHSRHRDRPPRLDLLPMASGKAKPDHIFLGETVGCAQLLYSLTEGTKELFLIDQACLLGDS
jgi:hypothetical protein